MGNEISQLNLEEIIPNRYQPREIFDDDSLKELASSIKQHGVIQPIIVRKVNDKYEIVDGERRYKASLLAGLTNIPAIIRSYDEKESARIALIDNLQRKDLSPIEEARAYKRLLEMEDMTQDELATTLGKSQSAVANKIRLLNLPIEIQEALLNNRISERHARSLLTVKDTRLQLELLNKVIEKKMTVRELDSEIKNMSNMFIPEEFNYTGNDLNNENNNQFIPSMNETTLPDNNQFIPPMNDEKEEVNTNKFIGDINNNFDNPTEENNFINTPLNVNDNGSNPFITNSAYDAPIDSNINSFVNNETKLLNNNDIYTNPFTAIRENTERINNNLNNNSMFINNDYSNQNNNQFINQNEPTNVDNNIYNTNDNSSLDNNRPLNNDNNFDINAPASFNIDDYKLPGVDYSESKPSNEEVTGNIYNELDIKANEPVVNNEYRYVEDNPNYTSADKNNGVSSLEDVINVLKSTLDRLKQGTVKIDTEEIDFDDCYQIVIKVDKKGDLN